jgi:hypothetical protein
MEQKLSMNDDYILYFVAVYIDTKRGNEKPYIDERQIGKRKQKGAVIYNILNRASQTPLKPVVELCASEA